MPTAEYQRKRDKAIKDGTWVPTKRVAMTPDERRARKRENWKRRRLEMIEHYGGKCACCGEHRPEFLAIDHINGGGRRQEKELGGSNSYVYAYIRRHNFPPGFRVLCHNCNMAYGLYGFCPHQDP